MRPLWLAFVLCAALAGAEPVSQPTVVLISGESEYQSAETLPAFRKHLEAGQRFRCVYLARTGEKEQNIPGLETLDSADLAIIFIRRLTLPEEQLAHFRKFVAMGKPVIGLRTASHAFENWKEWDREVLGGNYQNHYGKDLLPAISVVPEAAGHPILKGVRVPFTSAGSLYRNSPLPAGSVPLLTGTVPGKPPEPVAWIHSYNGTRVFYTSLGHRQDFESNDFKRLLVNAIDWCLSQPAVRKVDVDEFAKLMQVEGCVVLDVRSPKEYAAGHMSGAINLDVNSADFEQRIAGFDKAKTYLVHCAAGGRSATACGRMETLGFKRLVDLPPGFRAWEKAGKPIEK